MRHRVVRHRMIPFGIISSKPTSVQSSGAQTRRSAVAQDYLRDWGFRYCYLTHRQDFPVTTCVLGHERQLPKAAITLTAGGSLHRYHPMGCSIFVRTPRAFAARSVVGVCRRPISQMAHAPIQALESPGDWPLGRCAIHRRTDSRTSLGVWRCATNHETSNLRTTSSCSLRTDNDLLDCSRR